MTALTQAGERDTRGLKTKRHASYVVDSGSQIWAGGLVCAQAAADTVVPGADTSGLKCVGIAEESVLGDGIKRVKVSFGHEARFPRNAAVTAAFIGVSVTIEDDDTVSAAGTTTNDVAVGPVVELDGASHAWVAIEGPGAA